MVKKTKYKKKSFESDGTTSDVSANIYKSMLLSSAWKSLSSKQRDLYLMCKLQYYAQKKKPNTNDPTQFYFNQTKWLNEYNLYPPSNLRGFYKDMEILIKKGFVRCIYSNSFSRKRNIYQYSNKWQLYNTPEFKIETEEMTSSMLKKLSNSIKDNQ